MASNFKFLETEFPSLAEFGNLAEQYCYTDPNSCLMKLGMIGETIVKLMFRYDKIPAPYEDSAVNRINVLSSEGLLTKELVDILHALRKVRNKAVHENYAEETDCPIFLQMTYSLSEWFMQTYGDWNYQHKDFVMPKKGENSIVFHKEKEKEREEELVKVAIASADKAEKVDRKVRQEQANKMASQRHKTEAETRYMIDWQLRQVGWEANTETICYAKGARPEKGRNKAIAEWPTNSSVGKRGYADYALFVGTKLVGIIEAKAEYKDIPSVLDYQGKDYPKNIREEDKEYQLGTWGKFKVPFTFATNGRAYCEQFKTKSGIWFLDLRNSSNIPTALHGWISPDGIMELLERDIQAGNDALQTMSYDFLTDTEGLNLRDYQVKAIQAAEKAVLDGKKEILIAMATGTGKTRTVLGMIYRFLKTNRFKRILFLVDRTSLGDQTYDVFRDVKLEELMTLDEIYNIKGLEDKVIDRETRIQIATVQSMVKRILYNEGDRMPAVSDFDLIIIDEAHRGFVLDKEMGDVEVLYRDQREYQSRYRSVIEYFHAVKIALTATPAVHTTKIFGEPVYKYSYRQAVIDSYLVDHDAPHRLETELSKNGIHYKAKDEIIMYNPNTGEIINSEFLEDELNFDIDSFNKKVITEEFNRTVLEEIAKNIDPENPTEQGKTLIYAVNDQHADMIVSILREIYCETGVDNNAIMKITGKVGDGNPKKVKEAIKLFKNEKFPSIAVTVDLLTTGIDVPEITTLVFMRRVKSRILFEQMLGRATRLCPEIKKTHFEIYDAVGTYDALEPVNTMKPVVVNPKITFTQILDILEQAEEEEIIQAYIDQIIAKLQRRKHKMDKETIEQFINLTGGMNPTEFIYDITKRSFGEAKERLLGYREVFAYIQKTQINKENMLVISKEKDRLISHTRGYGNSEKPEDYLEAFSNYINTHMNEIAALNVVCTRPKDLTRESLKSLRLILDRQGFTTQQLNTAISEFTNEEMAADIISLIRRYAIGSPLISHEEKIRKAVDKLKKSHNFSKQELSWIGRMKKYLIEESVLNMQVFNEDSRFKNYGGFSKINKIFQNNLENIVHELNEYLYDDGGRIA